MKRDGRGEAFNEAETRIEMPSLRQTGPGKALIALLLASLVCQASIWWVLVPDQVSAQQEAEQGFVTNLGRTILAKASLIVCGTISQNSKQSGTRYHRSLVVEEVLWGRFREQELELFFLDPKHFDRVEGRVVVALAPIAGSAAHFDLVGAPVILPATDVKATRGQGPQDETAQGEAQATLDALKDYLALEAPDDRSRGMDRQARIERLHDTLLSHLRQGGTPARFAAVELLFAVKHDPDSCSHERYTRYAACLGPLVGTPTENDLRTALRGMITEHLKDEASVLLLRSEQAAEGNEGLNRLLTYFKAFPEAFDGGDVERIRLVALKLDAELQRNANQLAATIERTVDKQPRIPGTGANDKVGVDSPALKDQPGSFKGGSQDRPASQERSPFVAPEE